jgi:hypothetical protein
LHHACDFAFQIYPGPTTAQIGSGQFALNFGLWQARPSANAVAFLRALLWRMIRSVEIHVKELSMDTCNDQNALNALLNTQSEWLCGWYYQSVRYLNRVAGTRCVWISLLDAKQYVTATPWLIDRVRLGTSAKVRALHWTGYWGGNLELCFFPFALLTNTVLGHTFAKISAMQTFNQFQLQHNVPTDCPTLQFGNVNNISALASALTLALVTHRTLVVPTVSCNLHPLARTGKITLTSCGPEYFFRMDGWLTLSRALRKQVGYNGHIDTLQCDGSCAALVVRASSCPLLVSMAPGGATVYSVRQLLYSQGTTISEHVLVEQSPSLMRLLDQFDISLASATRRVLQRYVRRAEAPESFQWPSNETGTISSLMMSDLVSTDSA